MVRVSTAFRSGTSIALLVQHQYTIKNTGTDCTKKLNVKNVALIHKINVNLISCTKTAIEKIKISLISKLYVLTAIDSIKKNYEKRKNL